MIIVVQSFPPTEKVQKNATKILPQLKHKNYTERLKACKLFRHIRGDMIETYKILSGKYDRSATPTLPVAGPAVTRGHNLRLHKFRAIYDLRKYITTIISSKYLEFSALKVDLIISGKIRILFMIISQIFTEPETEVK